MRVGPPGGLTTDRMPPATSILSARPRRLAADVGGGLAVQPGQQLVYRLQLLSGTRAEPGRERLALLVGHGEQPLTRFPYGLGLLAAAACSPICRAERPPVPGGGRLVGLLT